MSGARPTPPADGRPVSGVAAGTAYFALPPTAVDARPAGPTRLILAWPGFDPPRGASALAAAVPMTGVPAWRVYVDLPGSGAGFDSAGLLENEGLLAYGTAVERAVEHLPALLAEIRRELRIDEGPVGLAGFSVGAAVALHALARGTVPVSAVAAIAPIISPTLAARPMERRSGRERSWDREATALADRLDLAAQAGRIAGRGAALLFVGGATDRVTPTRELAALRDLLRQEGAEAVEAATLRMGHALAAEPGTDPQPPTTEAVRVDAALTDWFRDHLAEVLPVAAEYGGEHGAEHGAEYGAAMEPGAASEPGPAAGTVPVDMEIRPAPAQLMGTEPVHSPMGTGPMGTSPMGGGPMGAGPPADLPSAGDGDGGDQVRLSTW